MLLKLHEGLQEAPGVLVVWLYVWLYVLYRCMYHFVFVWLYVWLYMRSCVDVCAVNVWVLV